MLTLRGSNQTTVKDIVNLRKFTADEFSQLHAVLLDVCRFLAGSLASGLGNASTTRLTRFHITEGCVSKWKMPNIYIVATHKGACLISRHVET